MSKRIEKGESPKRTYRGASPAERAETRRHQLIAAAIQVYGELGYRNASVKAVCAAAGLTDRYFYEAFENSEALLAVSFEVVTQQVLAETTLAAESAGNDPVERAKAMLHAYFSALRRETARARVFLVEMTGISPTIDAVFDATLGRIGEIIIETLDPERRGPLPKSPLLARGVAQGLIGIATAWIRGGYAEPTEKASEAAFILCSIAAPGGGALRA